MNLVCPLCMTVTVTGFFFNSGESNQGSVHGGFQTVVRVLLGNEILPASILPQLCPPLPQFYLILTSLLPLLNLNSTSVASGISNHSLETSRNLICNDCNGTVVVGPLSLKNQRVNLFQCELFGLPSWPSEKPLVLGKNAKSVSHTICSTTITLQHVIFGQLIFKSGSARCGLVCRSPCGSPMRVANFAVACKRSH